MAIPELKKPPQHTQILHSLIAWRRLAIDKRVSGKHRTHALSLRTACYHSCVVDCTCLSVPPTQRADVNHAGLTAPHEGSALGAVALCTGEPDNLAHGINTIGPAVGLQGPRRIRP
jgi:hypothetical protein